LSASELRLKKKLMLAMNAIKSIVRVALVMSIIAIVNFLKPTACVASVGRDVRADTTVSKNDSTFTVVDVPAEFPGGMEALVKFLSGNVRYPAEARRAGHQGTIFVCFVVHADGTLSKPYVVKGIAPELDAEALRVVSLFPNWIPAKLKEEPAPSRYVLPIKFTLAGKGKSQKLRRSDWH
jgi:periplasmic protein TonB